MTKVKKSTNGARPLEFSLFPYNCRVEYMECKFFTETDNLKQKRALLESITPIVI